MPESGEDKTTEDEDGDHCQSDLDVVKSAVHDDLFDDVYCDIHCIYHDKHLQYREIYHEKDN